MRLLESVGKLRWGRPVINAINAKELSCETSESFGRLGCPKSLYGSQEFNETEAGQERHLSANLVRRLSLNVIWLVWMLSMGIPTTLKG